MTRSVETASSADSELSLPAPKERRRLREAAELTHEEVAAALGVTAATVRSWESGRTAPRGRKREVYTRFLARLADPTEAAAPTGEPGEAKPARAAEDPAADPPAANAPAEPATAEATADGPAAVTGEPIATTVATTGEPAEPDEPAEPAEPAEQPTAVPAQGPAEAFDALYARAARDLARQAYLLTGRGALALEAVEKAFVQAWARWPEVATDPDPVGWVRAIVYEYALSPWHRFRRAHRHPDKPPPNPRTGCSSTRCSRCPPSTAVPSCSTTASASTCPTPPPRPRPPPPPPGTGSCTRTPTSPS